MSSGYPPVTAVRVTGDAPSKRSAPPTGLSLRYSAAVRCRPRRTARLCHRRHSRRPPRPRRRKTRSRRRRRGRLPSRSSRRRSGAPAGLRNRSTEAPAPRRPPRRQNHSHRAMRAQSFAIVGCGVPRRAPSEPARRSWTDRTRHRASATAVGGGRRTRPLREPVTSRTITLGGTSYPLFLPNIRDPRLHVAAVIITIHVLGQVGLHFHVSVPQILAAILASAIIEVALTFRRIRSFAWPASAMLTGSGVALILRVSARRRRSVEHQRVVRVRQRRGLSLLSKYVIRYRGTQSSTRPTSGWWWRSSSSAALGSSRSTSGGPRWTSG